MTTRAGVLLSAISPFGRAERQRSGTYALAAPPDAIHDDALPVIVTITEANMPPRPPTPAEVEKLQLLVPGATK